MLIWPLTYRFADLTGDWFELNGKRIDVDRCDKCLKQPRAFDQPPPFRVAIVESPSGRTEFLCADHLFRYLLP